MSICSGGLPEKIPRLSWQNLKDFHAKHYSPDNARFYSYGNLSLEDHLEASAPYLPTGDDFPKSSVDRVPNEPKFSKPKSQHITCALDPSNPTGRGSLIQFTSVCFIAKMSVFAVTRIMVFKGISF